MTPPPCARTALASNASPGKSSCEDKETKTLSTPSSEGLLLLTDDTSLPTGTKTSRHPEKKDTTAEYPKRLNPFEGSSGNEDSLLAETKLSTSLECSAPSVCDPPSRISLNSTPGNSSCGDQQVKNPSATSSAGEVPLTDNISPPKSTKKRRKKKKKKAKKAPPSNDHENMAVQESNEENGVTKGEATPPCPHENLMESNGKAGRASPECEQKAVLDDYKGGLSEASNDNRALRESKRELSPEEIALFEDTKREATPPFPQEILDEILDNSTQAIVAEKSTRSSGTTSERDCYCKVVVPMECAGSSSYRDVRPSSSTETTLSYKNIHEQLVECGTSKTDDSSSKTVDDVAEEAADGAADNDLGEDRETKTLSTPSSEGLLLLTDDTSLPMGTKTSRHPGKKDTTAEYPKHLNPFKGSSGNEDSLLAKMKLSTSLECSAPGICDPLSRISLNSTPGNSSCGDQEVKNVQTIVAKLSTTSSGTTSERDCYFKAVVPMECAGSSSYRDLRPSSSTETTLSYKNIHQQSAESGTSRTDGSSSKKADDVAEEAADDVADNDLGEDIETKTLSTPSSEGLLLLTDDTSLPTGTKTSRHPEKKDTTAEYPKHLNPFKGSSGNEDSLLAETKLSTSLECSAPGVCDPPSRISLNSTPGNSSCGDQQVKNPSATLSAGEVPLTGNISPPKSTKKRRKKKKKKGKKAPPSNDHENMAMQTSNEENRVFKVTKGEATAPCSQENLMESNGRAGRAERASPQCELKAVLDDYKGDLSKAGNINTALRESKGELSPEEIAVFEDTKREAAPPCPQEILDEILDSTTQTIVAKESTRSFGTTSERDCYCKVVVPMECAGSSSYRDVRPSSSTETTLPYKNIHEQLVESGTSKTDESSSKKADHVAEEAVDDAADKDFGEDKETKTLSTPSSEGLLLLTDDTSLPTGTKISCHPEKKDTTAEYPKHLNPFEVSSGNEDSLLAETKLSTSLKYSAPSVCDPPSRISLNSTPGNSSCGDQEVKNVQTIVAKLSTTSSGTTSERDCYFKAVVPMECAGPSSYRDVRPSSSTETTLSYKNIHEQLAESGTSRTDDSSSKKADDVAEEAADDAADNDLGEDKETKTLSTPSSEGLLLLTDDTSLPTGTKTSRHSEKKDTTTEYPKHLNPFEGSSGNEDSLLAETKLSTSLKYSALSVCDPPSRISLNSTPGNSSCGDQEVKNVQTIVAKQSTTSSGTTSEHDCHFTAVAPMECAGCSSYRDVRPSSSTETTLSYKNIHEQLAESGTSRTDDSSSKKADDVAEKAADDAADNDLGEGLESETTAPVHKASDEQKGEWNERDSIPLINRVF